MTVEDDVAGPDVGDHAAPRGKLHGVAPYVRHLWSVLYRATRRHAVRIDGLLTRADRVEAYVAELRGARGEELREYVRLSSRVVDLEEANGLLVRDVQELTGRVVMLERLVHDGNLP